MMDSQAFNPEWADKAKKIGAAFRIRKGGPRPIRLTLHPGQAAILKESRRFNVLDCGRRFGKTQFGLDQLIEVAAQGFPVGYFAPTYKELAESWRDLKEAAKAIIQKPSEQEKRLELVGGGAIDCWSLESPDSIRGRPYKLAVVDEAAQVANLKYAWENVIRPMLADYQGHAWFLSTPRGMNYFWQLYTRGQDPLQPSWASWSMPTSTNPYIEQSEIDSAQEELPATVFAQEYLASFIEDAGVVFRNILECATAIEQKVPIPHHVYIVGCDWGKYEDFSVFTVIDCTTREVVKVERFNQIDYLFQIDRLRVLCETFQPRTVVEEQTGNIALTELLYRTKYKAAVLDLELNATGEYEWKPLPIQPFKTTNASKSEAVQAVALALERQDLRILLDPVLIAELQAFSMERLPSGLMRYGAPAGFHDDCVLSLCFAWWEARQVPRDLNLSREGRVVVKYQNRLARSLKQIEELGYGAEERMKVIQSNIVHRDRELEKVGDSRHYLADV